MCAFNNAVVEFNVFSPLKCLFHFLISLHVFFQACMTAAIVKGGNNEKLC